MVGDLVEQDPRPRGGGAAIDHGDMLGELREEQALLEPGVARAQDHELGRALVEGTVAGGAEVHAGADEVILARGTCAAVGRARGYQRRAGRDLLARRERDDRATASGIDGLHRDGRQQLDAVASGLLGEAIGELGAADPLREAGVVVESLGDTRLPAERGPLDDQGAQVLAGGVDRRRQAGRPTADDHDVVGGAGCLTGESELLGELLVRGLRHVRPVGEDDRRDDLLAAVEGEDRLHLLGMRLEVDVAVRDALVAEEGLAATAVGAPGGAVEDDLGLGHRWLRSRTLGQRPRNGRYRRIVAAQVSGPARPRWA